jgi:dTDP-glucose 4,6-dehydratase
MTDHILVTGGLGFIGSDLVRRWALRGARVTNVDVGTYAGDPRRLAAVDSRRLETVALDVTDPALEGVLAAARPDVVVHLAAETHVTRSETEAELFFKSNVDGTRSVLDAAVAAGVGHIVHVSTDEVYGSCDGKPFTEDQKESGEGAASSAYARSKALADDLAQTYFDRAPVVVVRPTNCFGPWQHPEKAIPRWIVRALTGRRLPVWGDGRQMRDWMAVEDLCSGIDLLIEHRVTQDVFNVAPEGSQRSNLEVALAVARAAGRDPDSVYLSEYDRPSHDRRYAIDASKLRALGWAPTARFEERLAATVDWYRDNEAWWGPLVGEAESLYSDETARASR